MMGKEGVWLCVGGAIEAALIYSPLRRPPLRRVWPAVWRAWRRVDALPTPQPPPAPPRAKACGDVLREAGGASEVWGQA